MTATNNIHCNTVKEDMTSTTEKITGFFSDKIDDAKYQLQARQRKFEISGANGKIGRKQAKLHNWFDKEIRSKAEETKGHVQTMTGIGTRKQEHHPHEDVGEGDRINENLGCCSNACGLFST